jgi:sterol desaturase/sphingolipid hydroxylase (fatty acid hydroxylase superfamily)
MTDLREVQTLRAAAREFFSRPGPRRLAAHAAGAWIARVFCGPPSVTEIPVVGAVVAWWPFQEWFAHKFVLHPRTPRIARLAAARRHFAHHENPGDADLTLLPFGVVKASLPAALAFWAVAGLGSPRRVATGVATYATLALLYEWTHFLVHTGYRPRSRYFRRVRLRHRLHHGLDPQSWLGFTWPGIDDLMGTAPDPRDVGRKRRAGAAAAWTAA